MCKLHAVDIVVASCLLITFNARPQNPVAASLRSPEPCNPIFRIGASAISVPAPDPPPVGVRSTASLERWCAAPSSVRADRELSPPASSGSADEGSLRARREASSRVVRSTTGRSNGASCRSPRGSPTSHCALISAVATIYQQVTNSRTLRTVTCRRTRPASLRGAIQARTSSRALSGTGVALSVDANDW